MEEAERVLDRLARIQALERDGGPPDAVLEELRALVEEAEAWARVEGGERAEAAAGRLREALARDMIAV